MNAINIMKRAQELSGITITLTPEGKYSLAYTDGSTKRPLILSNLSDVALVLDGELECISA